MWFILALFALVMLVIRRTTEKTVSGSIDSLALAWLQQAWAIPFILVTLLFAKFYVPTELSTHFWKLMAIYATCCAIDLFCYFKALSLADITFVAPLLSLVAVGNIVGAYFVLGQKPSLLGALGAILIVHGAVLINVVRRKRKEHIKHIKKNNLALLLILLLVVVRSYFSNIEVQMLRESNPTSFNFYSSMLTIPILVLVAFVINKRRRTEKYWSTVVKNVRSNMAALAFIGATYTVNLTATYAAKLLSPNAGYVGAVKSAQVLPMVIIGVIFFKEKIEKLEWVALVAIIFGLIALGIS